MVLSLMRRPKHCRQWRPLPDGRVYAICGTKVVDFALAAAQRRTGRDISIRFAAPQLEISGTALPSLLLGRIKGKFQVSPVLLRKWFLAIPLPKPLLTVYPQLHTEAKRCSDLAACMICHPPPRADRGAVGWRSRRCGLPTPPSSSSHLLRDCASCYRILSAALANNYETVSSSSLSPCP